MSVQRRFHAALADGWQQQVQQQRGHKHQAQDNKPIAEEIHFIQVI